MGSGQIIVTCTSTAGRLRLLFYMLQSLKHQGTTPDKIFIQLSTEPYLSDSGVPHIPQWLRQEPVELAWVENTGPYRKLIPLINDCRDEDLVVTADDDVLYHPEWLSSLCSAAKVYEGHIVCARARRMRRSPFGGWQNYSLWPVIRKAETGMDLLPTGAGGVAYRRRLLDMDFLNDRAFLDIAPTADDLWFRMASRRCEVPVFADPEINEMNLYMAHGYGLDRANLNKRGTRFAQKVYGHTLGRLRDWIGVDAAENDRVWRRIELYARD